MGEVYTRQGSGGGASHDIQVVTPIAQIGDDVTVDQLYPFNYLTATLSATIAGINATVTPVDADTVTVEVPVGTPNGDQPLVLTADGVAGTDDVTITDTIIPAQQQFYAAYQLGPYTYNSATQGVERIGDGIFGVGAEGTRFTGGGFTDPGSSTDAYGVVVRFERPVRITEFTINLGQSDGGSNAPKRLYIYNGSSISDPLLFTETAMYPGAFDSSEKTPFTADVSGDSNFIPVQRQDYLFVFADSNSANLSVREIQITGIPDVVNTAIVQDNFTGAAATDPFGGRIPDIVGPAPTLEGTGTAELTGGGELDVLTTSAGFSSLTAGYDIVILDNYEVEMWVVFTTGGSHSAGIDPKIQNSSNRVNYSVDVNGTIRLRRVVGGSETIVASTTRTVATGVVHYIRATYETGQISCYLNGELMFVATETAFSTESKIGIRLGSTGDLLSRIRVRPIARSLESLRALLVGLTTNAPVLLAADFETTQDSDRRVSNWEDSNASGDYSATGANRPTYVPNVFGDKGGIVFDGSNSLDASGANIPDTMFISASETTVFLFGTIDQTLENLDCLFSFDWNTSSRFMQLISDGSGDVRLRMFTPDSSTAVITPVIGQNITFAARRRDSSAQIDLKVDDGVTFAAAGGSNPSTLTALSIGSNQVGGTDFSTITVALFVVFGERLTDVDRDAALVACNEYLGNQFTV